VFSFYLLSVCSAILLSVGALTNLTSFLSDCVAVDWDISDYEKGMLNDMFYLGIIVGCLFLGPLADVKLDTFHLVDIDNGRGRKPMLVLSCFILTLGGIFTPFSNDLFFLCLFRFMVGLGTR